ncbi:MAG: Gfo/Idh/MocA family protein [Balneolaceae bacterium]
MKKVRFGILSTAKIGVEKVIPAMQRGSLTKITAIASRNKKKAGDAAGLLKIPEVFDSYGELLKSADVDAVYIPLPNHLHVPWAIKALEAGKHVLCEKPIGMSVNETKHLIAVSRNYPGLKIMEAFMYRHHPRWRRTKKLIEDGTIGELKSIHSFFTYYKDDPDNIRFKPEMGGGGLMDVGCYNISLSRFLYGKQPEKVQSLLKYHPEYSVDILASGLLDFGSGTATFTCSMQSSGFQFVEIIGTEGRIEMDVPFNPPDDKPTELRIYSDESTEIIAFEPCNHYTIQGDLFARAIIDKTEVPTPLGDALENMEVIEQILKK